MNIELKSIQIGEVSLIEPSESADWRFSPMTSGIRKSSVDRPIYLTRTGLEGDEQSDLRMHGGPDKAVCVYAREHYDAWASELGRKLACPGAFGENFTVGGCLESDIHIGDVFLIGDAVVQCSQPRQPCSKLARFWGIKDFVIQVNKEGRSGWYFRVLKEGQVKPGDVLSLTERKWRDYSVAYANKIMLAGEKGDWNEIFELAGCPDLSLSWKKQFETYLQRMPRPI